MDIFGKQKAPKTDSETQAPQKQKRRFAPYLTWGLIGIACVALIAVIAGVFGGEEEVDLVSHIYYNANGGTFNDNQTEKHFGHETGAYPLNITTESTLTSGGPLSLATRTGYSFVGWYEAETDENGNIITYDELDVNGYPVYETDDEGNYVYEDVIDEEGNIVYETDENGNFIYETDENGEQVKVSQKTKVIAQTVQLQEEPFDFSKPLEDGAQIRLYAKWNREAHVVVRLTGTAVQDETIDVDYKLGEIIKEVEYDGNRANEPKSNRLISGLSGYTFVEYYYDAECTRVVSWPIDKTDALETVVYARYMEGDWVIVKDKSTAETMLTMLDQNAKYYVLNDVDMGGKTLGSAPAGKVNSLVVGNGYTISNFKVDVSQVNEDTALFGEVMSSASITDLTLTGVEYDVSVKNGAPNICFLFTSVEEGAKISGLAVNGTMSISCSSNVDGVFNIGAAETSQWIVGGEGGETWLAQGFIDVTVDNCELKETEIIEEETNYVYSYYHYSLSGGYCTAVDADNDHKCDNCGMTLTQCVDEDSDNMCDICGTELSADNTENENNTTPSENEQENQQPEETENQ